MTPTDSSVTQPNETTDPRRAYVNGLRQLAAFIEQHPDLPCPGQENHLIPAGSKARLVAIMRAAPSVRWEKDFNGGDYFSIKTTFDGGHVYDVYVERGEICRKVITGRRIEPAKPEHEVEEFEWVCDEPLLATKPELEG